MSGMVVVFDLVDIEWELHLERYAIGHVVAPNRQASHGRLPHWPDFHVGGLLRLRRSVEECVRAPHVVYDGAVHVAILLFFPSVRREREQLLVVVDDIHGSAESRGEAAEHDGGDSHVSPAALGVRRLFRHRPPLKDVVVDLYVVAHDAIAVDSEVVRIEAEERDKVDGVLPEHACQWRQVRLPVQVRLVDDMLQLVELLRAIRRHVLGPELDVRLKLSLGLRHVRWWRAIVPTGMVLELEVVENGLDLLDALEGRLAVPDVAAIGLRAIPDGDHELMRDAPPVEVLVRLRDHVALPQHL